MAEVPKDPTRDLYLLPFTGDFRACPVLSFNQPLILQYTSMYGTIVITVYLPHAIELTRTAS
jgi:hypothetical protein